MAVQLLLCGVLPPELVQYCLQRDELISYVFKWTSSHGRAKAGRPARTYIQQLYADMGCSPDDRLEAVDDWEEWQEMVRDICADGAT